MGGNQNKQVPHGLKKNALKKNSREKNYKIIWSLLLLNLFKEDAHCAYGENLT